MRRRRERRGAFERAGDHGHLHAWIPATRDVLGPEHREVRRGELVLARQVQPDLKQLQRVRPVAIEQREHLRVDDASTRRQPLHVAHPEPRRRAERIRMVDVALADDGHRLEPAVRVLWKPGDHVTVIHPPAVAVLEILSDVMPGERSRRSTLIVALRIEIDVVDAEQERIERPSFAVSIAAPFRF